MENIVKNFLKNLNVKNIIKKISIYLSFYTFNKKNIIKINILKHQILLKGSK